MNSLVGYTGFVGSNLCEQCEFDAVYNSKNIEEAYGTKPNLLIYSGIRAEKYIANSSPQKDMEAIIQAEENIRKIDPVKLVLISTIDIFKKPVNVDENSEIETDGLHPYGYNRYMMERWVRENYTDALIVRLPGLFGKNIKKNFIYDFINRIPFMLKEEKIRELNSSCPNLSEYYMKQDNGFYKVKELTDDEKATLKAMFSGLSFSALNFTDSRSVYQFYPLSRLWDDIQLALRNDVRLLHTATPPVSVAELYSFLTGDVFTNELPGVPAVYDYRTVHSGMFGGKDGYICDKASVLSMIKEFVAE